MSTRGDKGVYSSVRLVRSLDGRTKYYPRWTAYCLCNNDRDDNRVGRKGSATL